jgi:nicotinamide-nucleotide amidase
LVVELTKFNFVILLIIGNMKAEIISIGDELLIGQTVNTNAAWIGAELSGLGFEISQITTIPDRRERILHSLSESTGRTDVIILTGGLGPTSDDITKPTLCEFFNTRLVENKKVLGMIEEILQRRNFSLNENNRKQAEVPENSRVLFNHIGTAPGMWFEKNGTIIASLPGVPPEMKNIMQNYVIPELRKQFRSQVIIHKNIMTYGEPEARLAEILADFETTMPANVKIAYLPSFGIIKLRLTGTGKSREETEKAVAEQVAKLYKTIPSLIYGEDEESLERKTGTLLRERKATMCTAESCTGGKVAQMITSIPGSSDYFKGSVIAYDNKVKSDLLNVPEDYLQEFGAVSRETVMSMAEGAMRLFNTDFAVATSGIAGPSGGTDDKPVGTVWIAVASEARTTSESFIFGTERNYNIMRFSVAALDLLRREIIS